MAEGIVTVTDADFATVVEAADKPVILDFWAPWCGPCRMMEPVMEEIAAEHAGKVIVGKVNVDENPAIAMRFDVMSIPTFLVFSGGKMVNKLVGQMPKRRLDEALSQL